MNVDASSLQFEPTPEVIRSARDFVQDCLGPYGGDITADVLLFAANELITNAVLHGRTRGRVTVRCVEAGSVRIEVYDRNSRPPQLWEVRSDATSGRGLALIDSLGLVRGTDIHEDGKTVWVQTPESDGRKGND